MCSLGKILLAFLYSKAKLACYSKYLLTSYFFIPVPYDEKGISVVLALEGLLFPVVYWTPTDLGGSSSGVICFNLLILFMGFSRQEYWNDLPFPSPVGHICQNSAPWPIHPGWIYTAWVICSPSYTRLWSMWLFCKQKYFIDWM